MYPENGCIGIGLERLLGKEVKTLEQKVVYSVSAITPSNVKFEKVQTGTPIYVPRRIFVNAKKDLSEEWMPISPRKESAGTGYDGILKSYTKTMVSHVVAPALVELGLCEVRKDKGKWEIRLKP